LVSTVCRTFGFLRHVVRAVSRGEASNVISGSAERREPGFEFFPDFVAGLAEGVELFFFRARGFGGVVYRPVEAVFQNDQAW